MLTLIATEAVSPSIADAPAILSYLNSGILTVIVGLFLSDRLGNNSERNVLRQTTQDQAKVIAEMLPIFSKLAESLPEITSALRERRKGE